MNELMLPDKRWGVSTTRGRERVPDEFDTGLQRVVGDVGYTREDRFLMIMASAKPFDAPSLTA